MYSVWNNMPEHTDPVLSGESLTILGVKVPITTQSLRQQKLKFFPENPRVYSVVRANGKHPTQEEIQQQLSDLEHVRELREDIKRVRSGIRDYLTPQRAQPRDSVSLIGDYRQESDDEAP